MPVCVPKNVFESILKLKDEALILIKITNTMIKVINKYNIPCSVACLVWRDAAVGGGGAAAGGQLG